jgi:ankyrin repeat protein
VRTFRQEYIFFRAVRNASDTELAKILEQDRIDPNKPKFRGKAALHMATEQGYEKIVTTLISENADLGIQTADGKTALQLAVEKPDSNMVEFLLKKGARSDSKYNNGKNLRDLLPPTTEERKAGIRKKIISLLDDPPLVDGPSFLKTFPLEHRERPRQGSDQDWPQPAPQPYGEKACKSFHITIGNFFFTNAGEEKSDIRFSSVYDVLYLEEPKAICKPVLDKAELTEEGLSNSHFTWYHVPANNVSWG